MGKIYLNDEAYGGDVVANPQETPTDTLSTIQIGDTVYSLPSGGGQTVGAKSNNTNAIQNNVANAISANVTSEIQ